MTPVESTSKFMTRPANFYFPQQFLYFLPLPQGHGSLRPTFGPDSLGFGFSFETSSAAWLTTSLAFLPEASAAGAPPLPNALEF